MADEQDAKVAAAYRALGAEEPPRTLDEAILAAARQPSARPERSWTRRWALPLSLAAVVVLSVTVTLRIQQELPVIEAPMPVAREAATEKAPPAASTPAAPDNAAVAAAHRVPAPAAAPAPIAAMRAAESSVAGADARVSEERMARDTEAAGALAKRSAPTVASAPMAALKAAPETPERELERIAGLRRDAKHEEADKALAEFRRRYPEYRIAEPMLERVERR
jgi:hypothetical protein